MTRFRLLCLPLLAAFLASCHVYHMPIQQGNFLPEDAPKHIKIGMSQSDLVDTLGTPVLKNIYKDHRVIYIYSLQPAHRWNVKLTRKRRKPIAYIQKQLVIVIQNGHVKSYHFKENEAAKRSSAGEW